MKLAVDTSAYPSITCSVAPEPVMNRQTGLQKADTNGEPLYSLELVAFGSDGAQVLNVKVAGTPHAGIKAGVPVKVTGLVASDWEVDNKHGISFRAARIEPAVGAQAPKAGAA